MDFTGDPVVKNPPGNAGHSKTKQNTKTIAWLDLACGLQFCRTLMKLHI